MRVKNRLPASRAQLQQRSIHAALTYKRIVKRQRRRRIGQALALPLDKAALRKALAKAAAGHPVKRID